MNKFTALEALAPTPVWQHFSMLCQTPRPSKNEARLVHKLVEWATSQGLAHEVDATGNLVIRKPATQGYEKAPTVVLQAHLDMVCQANAGTPHDFLTDSITPSIQNGWVLAENTTLGADNGMGVALILATLEDQSIAHGALEALFTVDEEAGMGGARGLTANTLTGTCLLNLDTEEWGSFYLGCAGGLDVTIAQKNAGGAPIPSGYATYSLTITGLRGGHSGVNIHEGRGHAIKLLMRTLQTLKAHLPIQIGQIRGGTARNAIPREAHALVAIPEADTQRLGELVGQLQATFAHELTGVESNVNLSYTACEFSEVMCHSDQTQWLNMLHAAPQGVYRMSTQMPEVVETSSNLGIVNITPQAGKCHFMVRSLVDSAALALSDEIVSLGKLAGFTVSTSGHYPGWQPNPDSALLKRCKQVFTENFGTEARTHVIHAGLECGIIGGKYPAIDMISFGPTIRGAHAPGEAVEIESVGHCWTLLKAILAALK